MTTSADLPAAVTGAPGSNDRHLRTAYMLTGSCDGRWLIGSNRDGAARAHSTARAVLPGGAVRADEAPTIALARLTTQQLGMLLNPLRLLDAAWQQATPHQPSEMALIFGGPLIIPDLLPSPPHSPTEPPALTWRLSDPTEALTDLPTAITKTLLDIGWTPPIGYGEFHALHDQPIGEADWQIQPASAKPGVIDTPSPCCTSHNARLTQRDITDITEDPTFKVRRRCQGCRRPYELSLVGTARDPVVSAGSRDDPGPGQRHTDLKVSGADSHASSHHRPLSPSG